MSAEVEIVPFEDRFAGDFDRLNREWLERFGLLEALDEQHLADPRGTIVAGGGELFLALRDGVVVGTCGIHPTGDGDYELVKLTVVESERGRGLARRLTARAIEHARNAGARRVHLFSSSRLAGAVRLYESMGFLHRPLSGDAGYSTADVYMELELPIEAV
ncbi:MAG TPA: GNAT family N-acetyltransferase [Thermoanaerobaculia bacterium]|nr:GNAT family N-acetyltransferase [Thermoanaerobaculia bacterium]